MGMGRSVMVSVIVVVGVVAGASAARAECPSLPRIQGAAERAAGLDVVESLRGRARLASLLPSVSLRGSQRRGWSELPAGRAVGDVDRGQTVEVRLSWRLDQLVFRDDEPRLRADEQAQRRARIALRQEVAQAYFRWRQAERDRASGPDADLLADAAFAQVDALTAGWLRDACQ